MNKNWRAVLLIAALNFVFSIASVAFAQDQIAGGYGETSTTDPEAVAAARFAVSRQGRKQRAPITLISVERAEVQVVAGLNYKVWLKVKSRGKTQNVTAVVYKNLKRQLSLTSWDVENSSAATNPSPSNSTIEGLVASIAEAFKAKSWDKLDAQRPYRGRVRIVIENSLAEDNAKDRFEARTFKTFAAAERWLTSQEIADYGPSRETKPLKRCSKGVCTYDFEGGISHNQLYIKRITYSIHAGLPFVDTIHLLDGD